jgi:hypothetical protein
MTASASTAAAFAIIFADPPGAKRRARYATGFLRISAARSQVATTSPF